MGLIKGLIFWGYVDDQGRLTVKRYTNDRAIENAEMMPYVKGIFDPFESVDMTEARQKCLEKLKQMQN